MTALNPFIRKPAYERHELSSVFGDMAPEEFADLKEDIKANGLSDPIMLHEGKVLDGWHRYRAMCELGRKMPKEKVFEFDPKQDAPDPETYVHSKNLFRRQLPAEDRVRLAAKRLGYENKGVGRKGSQETKATMKDVAKAAGVSEVTVKRMLGKKVSGDTIPKAPTLEALRKKEKALEAQLAKVRASILQAEKEAVAPPRVSARAGARVRSR